jgi:alpha-tubulin suppressor-like RCC1 family protein
VQNGTWSGTPASSYTYQWELCNSVGKKCTELAEGSESTYRITAAQVGETLRATVTDTNPAGSKSATSAVTEVIKQGPPVNTALPVISGSLLEGQELAGGTGEWAGTGTIEYAYTWASCNTEGSCTHTTGSRYLLSSADAGRTIKLEVTATNGLGSSTASSVASPAVLSALDDSAVSWGEDLHGQLGSFYRTLIEENPVPMEGETGITAIAAGGNISAALLADETVDSSGAGYYGSLGDGGRKATWEMGKSHVPTDDLTDVEAISAGSEFALARLDDGTLKGWGNNSYGTLGNGTGGFEKNTGENQLLPKTVEGLSGVRSVASGANTNYAVLEDGKVKAWGRNDDGQLGVAWTAECMSRAGCEPTALKPPGNEHIEAEHKCATETGWELCSKVPRFVVNEGGGDLEGVVAVSAGSEAAYALREDGEVVSWGGDSKGQLGQAGVEPGADTSFTPSGTVMVSKTEALKHVVEIAGGHNHALALLEDGEVVGWGDNEQGALGTLSGEKCGKGGGLIACDRYATVIPGLTGVEATAIAAGGGYSLVLSRGGRVYAFGNNKYGMLGNGGSCENEGGKMGETGTCFSRVPTAVPGVEDAQAISAGATHAIALLKAGTAPPRPVVSGEGSGLDIKLQWVFPGSEASERLLWRPWAHPGEDETAEGEGTEEGGSGTEEVSEEGTGTAPANVTLPRIRVGELEGEELKVIKTGAYVGMVAEATAGTWTGTEPIEYAYQWSRCKSSKCTAIPGATNYRYATTEEVSSYTLEVTVTAQNGVKPRGVATSEPSEVIKSEEAAGSASTPLTGGDSYVITDLYGSPLEAGQPYEVKLQSGIGSKSPKKTRVMVITP